MTQPDTFNDDLATFLDMARHGVNAAADREEQACYRLAVACIDDAQTLELPALRGFAAFTAIAHRSPDYCDQLIHATDAITA